VAQQRAIVGGRVQWWHPGHCCNIRLLLSAGHWRNNQPRAHQRKHYKRKLPAGHVKCGHQGLHGRGWINMDCDISTVTPPEHHATSAVLYMTTGPSLHLDSYVSAHWRPGIQTQTGDRLFDAGSSSEQLNASEIGLFRECTGTLALRARAGGGGAGKRARPMFPVVAATVQTGFRPALVHR
jgi:hypothetical protein